MESLVVIGALTFVILATNFKEIRGAVKKFLGIDKETKGEIDVTGHGEICILLSSKCIDKIDVKFKEANDCDQVPCDPGSDDFLSYHLCKMKKHSELKISWSVSRPMTIVWNVRH